MSESHHTPAQIAAAFAKAPKILAELTTLGAEYPSFELYGDASGTLWIGREPAKPLLYRAQELVRSNRLTLGMSEHVGIQFCCGLVEHEDANGG